METPLFVYRAQNRKISGSFDFTERNLHLQEFVYLTESINEGFDLYKKNLKQVFLFDDFLGSRFLLSNVKNNEDKRIVNFIEHIMKDSSKKLIFTTREYILKQANNELERLKYIEENGKCIVDLSNYSKLAKAKILYNHLYWNNVPVEYVASLLKNKNYKMIINHANYSPRLIESITKKNVLSRMTPDDYASNFIRYLDNPAEIWDFSFNNNISELARQILLVAVTTGTPVLEADLKLAVDKYRSQIYGKPKLNDFELTKAIKEIDDSFIRTSKADDGHTIIQFHNPSIQDYLTNFLSENPNIVLNLIKSSYFFNQYFAEYSIKKGYHKIFISPSVHKELINCIASDMDNPNISVIQIYLRSEKNSLVSYRRQDKSIITTLSYILKNSAICDYDISKIPFDEYVRKIPYEELDVKELDDFVSVLKYAIEMKKMDFDLKDVFEKTFLCIGSISDLLSFCRFKELDEVLFDEVVSARITEISDIIDEEIKGAYPDGYSEIGSFILELSEKMGCDFSTSLDRLAELESGYYDREPDDDDFIRYKERKSSDPDVEIDNLFGSLSID